MLVPGTTVAVALPVVNKTGRVPYGGYERSIERGLIQAPAHFAHLLDTVERFVGGRGSAAC